MLKLFMVLFYIKFVMVLMFYEGFFLVGVFFDIYFIDLYDVFIELNKKEDLVERMWLIRFVVSVVVYM